MTKKFILDKYNLTIYPAIVYVAKNYTIKDLQKYFKNVTEQDLNLGNAGITISGLIDKDGYDAILILLPKLTVKRHNTPGAMNTCAHEALHATIDLFDMLGQPVSPKYSEAYCYLCGYITECVYKTLKK